ncbi:MAG: hypothetical protein GTO14_09270 [Anaerolineales bacterium]|nr:hypothetical protein [Anaerolineales bacterium]
MKIQRAVIDLFIASALGLFVELIFIRWLGSELRIFSFYKNVALIAAYLGLGLGFIVYSTERGVRSLQRVYPALVTLIVVIVLGMGRTMVSDILLSNRANAEEYIWAGFIGDISTWILALLEFAFYAAILGIFLAMTIMFIPLGELVGAKFTEFKPLKGYTINILGSLAGVLAYTLISFLGWPPHTWFLLAAAGVIYFIPRAPRRDWWTSLGLTSIPIFLIILWPTPAERTVWSPYYRIDINESRAEKDPTLLLGYDLSVNLAWHQRLIDLTPSFVDENFEIAPAYFDAMQSEYDAPYSAASSMENVLIVGAGTGNDVAAALRAGASVVTAVEIDPKIFRLGDELHPEQPYTNPAVSKVTEDARSFFSHSSDTYDLIVFGLLDSHALFSTASSARLDNFVYTHESFLHVKELLTEDGLLALTFGVPPENEWMGHRLYRTITDAFGHPPQVFEFPNNDVLFLIGLDPETRYGIEDPRVQARPDYTYQTDIPATTDDWPYLYLREQAVPSTYLVTLIGIAILSFLLIRRNIANFTQFRFGFFFLGAGFFLLQTKSMTEMALLFGSTWVVNAAVISAILIMIVLANWVVIRFELRETRVLYILLFLSLIISYFIPIRTFLGLPDTLRTVIVSLEQAIPLFFASIIFAIRFQGVTSIPVALGSNLFGGVLGGLTEYASLALGIRSLYLFALAFYALSALSQMPLVRKGRTTPTG